MNTTDSLMGYIKVKECEDLVDKVRIVAEDGSEFFLYHDRKDGLPTQVYSEWKRYGGQGKYLQIWYKTYTSGRTIYSIAAMSKSMWDRMLSLRKSN